MLAARIQSGSLVVDPDCPEPAVHPGSALVRVHRVLISQSDVAVARGELPHNGVLGQVCVGTVERVEGGDARSLTGRMVVALYDLPDPASELARRGLGAHDPDREILGINGRDGCLCERVAIPTTALVAVPEGVDPDRAVFALPLAQSLHAAQIVRIPGKTFVTVLGDDLRALLSAQLLARLNASVRLLGTMPDRLERCARWNVRHRHRDDVGQWGDQDVVIVTTRDADSFALASGMVRPRGTIVLLGERPETISGCDLAPVIDREQTVVGARCGSLGEGVETLRSGSVDLDGLVTRRLRLSEADQAIRAAGDPASIAVLVDADR